MSQLATCVLAQHTTEIEEMVSAEYANACGLLQTTGLATQYPVACQ